MRPTQHRSNNDVLGAPAGMTVDECKPLPITRIEYSDGTPACVSFWTPTADELARLSAGQPVMISAIGRTHPPLCVLVAGDADLPL